VSSILSMPLSPTPPAVDPSMAQPEAPQYQAQGLGVGNLNRNPMLPQHPLGAYTDSQYEAELAQLKFEVAQRYNDVLQQLGYTDDNGNFVPGQVEIDSNRQKSELARNIQLADEQTTQQHQQQGTLFSGLRGTNQARAEYPFVNAMGQRASERVHRPKQSPSGKCRTARSGESREQLCRWWKRHRCSRRLWRYSASWRRWHQRVWRSA
jgi:hypothetical protein